MHTAFSGLSVSKICRATCDASLLPFSGMRAKFFDGIYGGKPTSQLQDKTFTIYLRDGVSVVMKKWKATRLYHLGFSLNIPGSSTATVIGLEAGTSYRYSLYQYSSDKSWVGHKSTVSINGGTAFTTSVTGGNDPSSRGTFVAGSDGTAEFLFTRMGDMHTAFSGLSVSKICRATCDASLLPFSGMRAKFFDGIYGGKPTSQLQDKTFTIYLRDGVSVVMKKWKATRLYHLGFSLNIPGSSTATVIGLEAGASYRYSLYQYSSDKSWVGHKSTVSINGGTAFTTSVTGGNDPSSTGTFVAGSDGTAEFLFTRMGDMHTAFSGLSVSKICRAQTTLPTTTPRNGVEVEVVVDVDDAASILLSASLIALVTTMIV